MIKPTTAGIELEYVIIDKSGKSLNVASEVLEKLNDNIVYSRESRKDTVEIRGAPNGAETITEIHKDVISSIKRLDDIVGVYGGFISPISVISKPDLKDINMDIPRLQVYPKLIGDENFIELESITGAHMHISQVQDKILLQYKIFQSLDPLSYGLTSTSPIKHTGENSLNCHRVNSTRNNVFLGYPLHSQIHEFPKSIEELDQFGEKMYQEWLNDLNWTDKVFREYNFNPDNTGFSPIRKRNNIGPNGTLEVRSFDNAPLEVLLSAFSLYKGTIDRVIEENPYIIDSEKVGEYLFSKNKIILPNFETRQHLEDESIRYGLKSEAVRDYCQHIIEYAIKGLPLEDKRYLERAETMVNDGKNIATQIMDYIKSETHQRLIYSPEQMQKTNLFLRDLHINDRYLSGF